jgi:hypothetical protein
VRLHIPPPLEVQLRLESAAEEAHLFQGGTLVAAARCAQLDVQVPPSPSREQAEHGSRSFLGFTTHPFPGCFVCGPDRRHGDGLRIFPGLIDGSTTVAAPWTADASLADESGKVRPEFLWSALDCTGAFAILPVADGVTAVLGELCVTIEDSLAGGEEGLVIGWPLGATGRKRFAGSAIYAPGGRLVAAARAVWVEVPLSSWG